MQASSRLLFSNGRCKPLVFVAEKYSCDQTENRKWDRSLMTIAFAYGNKVANNAMGGFFTFILLVF